MKYLLVSLTIFIQCACFSQSRTLNFFIGQAKQNSPLLKQYYNQILLNRLDSQILRASLRTQGNFLSNGLYAPVIKGYGYDVIITYITQLSGLLQASKQVVGMNNKAAQYETIRLQNKA